MSAAENYEKLLSAQHGRTIDFVKFAEAKNAALLTFCSVWMGSIVTMLRTGQALPPAFDAAFKAALAMLFVAALIALRSFLPKRLSRFFRPDDPEERNLLYFGDVAGLKIGTLAGRLRERYHSHEDAAFSERYLDDLVVQISVQSRIAEAKFKAFNRAAFIVLIGFVVVAAPALTWALRVFACWARRWH